MDQYGRKLPKEEGKRLVKKFYHIEDEQPESGDDEESGPDSSEEEYDPARGIGVVSSSEDSDDEDVEEEEDIEYAIIEEDVPKGDATYRLAAVNLDWDNIRAVDILAVLQSFIPVTSDQGIKKVSIYPSEFGKERMQKEATEGPALFESEKKPTESSNATGDVDTTALRRYQLDRLRYYYAVIECMSVSTANSLYKSLDGAEFGATANIFDLRFIPDGMTFEDKPKDEATGLPDDYEPADFVTDALQHSKPKLTWEGEDPTRKRMVSEAFRGDGESGKWAALLASSDEEEEDEEAREKYRQLLLGDTLPAPKAASKMDMTVAVDEEDEEVPEKPRNEQKEETTLEKYKRKERERKQRKYEAKQARKLAAQPADSTTDLGFDDPFFTTESTNSQKRKEKEAKRLAKEQAELEAVQQAQELDLLMHDETSGHHFNINHILKAQKAGKHKKKGKRDAEKERDLQEGFRMDVNDPRFAAVYSGGDFAIDPNSAAFKKGMKGMEAVLEESRRRKRGADGSPSNERKRKRK